MTTLGAAFLAQLGPDDLAGLAELLKPYLVDEARPVDAADGLLTCAQAAQRLGVHPETIRRAARAGRLPAHHVGRSLRISPADLVAWLQRGDEATVGQLSRPRRQRARRGGRRPLAEALASLD